MMADDEDVIFEGVLYRFIFKESRKPSLLGSKGGQWKERYYVLKRLTNSLVLKEYKKKPSSRNVVSKTSLLLLPKYSIAKKNNIRGKEFVIHLTTLDESLVLAAHSERLRDMFVFFVQTQTQLRDSLIPDCFNVRPLDSEDQRKIGARGSLCLLHISQWGITLALQLSRAILAQWPLKSIRFYESSGNGHFQFESGHRSPMGIGNYVFKTRKSEDDKMYDNLDKFVMSAACVAQQLTDQDPDEAISAEHSNLGDFTSSNLDNQFDVHHSRICNENYSATARKNTTSSAERQHSNEQENVPPLPIKDLQPYQGDENKDLLNHLYENSSQAARAKHKEAMQIDIPAEKLDRDVRPKMFCTPLSLKHSSNPVEINRREVSARKVQPKQNNERSISQCSNESDLSVKSEYLSMGSGQKSSFRSLSQDFSSTSFSPCNSAMMSPPPTFYELMNIDFESEKSAEKPTEKSAEKSPSVNYADMSGSVCSLDQLEDTQIKGKQMRGRKDRLPNEPGYAPASIRRGRFQRIKSTSHEDFTELMRNSLYNWNEHNDKYTAYENAMYELENHNTYEEATVDYKTETNRDHIQNISKVSGDKSAAMRRSMSNPNILASNDLSMFSANTRIVAKPDDVRKEPKKQMGFLNLTFLPNTGRKKKKSQSREKVTPERENEANKSDSVTTQNIMKGIQISQKTKSFTKKKPQPMSLSQMSSDSGFDRSVSVESKTSVTSSGDRSPNITTQQSRARNESAGSSGSVFLKNDSKSTKNPSLSGGSVFNKNKSPSPKTLSASVRSALSPPWLPAEQIFESVSDYSNEVDDPISGPNNSSNKSRIDNLEVSQVRSQNRTMHGRKLPSIPVDSENGETTV